MKIHGGFKEGDTVERRVGWNRWIGPYIVVDFGLFEVKIRGKGFSTSPTYTSWVSIHDIRHPHLVEKR